MRHFMSNWLAGDVLRDRANLAVQTAAYRERFGDKPAGAGDDAPTTTGLGVAIRLPRRKPPSAPRDARAGWQVRQDQAGLSRARH